MGEDMHEEATAEVTPTATSITTGEVPASTPRSEAPRGLAMPAQMPPQPGVVGCPTCGGPPGAARPIMQTAPSFVYAIGRIEARFPTPSVEKEFAQVAGRAPTAGKTDQQTFHEVLSQRQNRYLARQLCWVLTVQGLETYILQPRDPADVELLVEAIRPRPSPSDLDVVIGARGPIAPPELCNGLMVPIVFFDQIYSFTRDELIKAIPRPNGMAEDQFGPAAEELFDRIMQMTDNAGATDESSIYNGIIHYRAISSFGTSLASESVRKCAQ
jgi:PatG Domain